MKKTTAYKPSSTYEEVMELFRELAKEQKENYRQWQEYQRTEAEAKKEAEKRNKEWDKKMRELQELFTGQWGKLVEALMAPGCLKLFQERGIKISEAHPGMWTERDGKHIEIDLMLVNGDELILVEIKTTARVADIKQLQKQVENFKTFFPRYAPYKVYGAIAALSFHQKSDEYAQKQGYFVIKANGEGLVKLANNTEFKPKSH